MKKYYAIFSVSVMLITNSAFSDYVKTIYARVDDLCLEVSFEQGTSAELSCQYPIEISYYQKDCLSQKTVERGKNMARLSCPENSGNTMKWQMQFKTSNDAVSLILHPIREPKGKLGFVTNYKVFSAEKIKDHLPAPKIIFKKQE